MEFWGKEEWKGEDMRYYKHHMKEEQKRTKPSILKDHCQIREGMREGSIKRVEPGQINFLINILGENWKEEAGRYIPRLEEGRKQEQIEQGKEEIETETSRNDKNPCVRTEERERDKVSGKEGEEGESKEKIYHDPTEGEEEGESSQTSREEEEVKTEGGKEKGEGYNAQGEEGKTETEREHISHAVEKTRMQGPRRKEFQ